MFLSSRAAQQSIFVYSAEAFIYAYFLFIATTVSNNGERKTFMFSPYVLLAAAFGVAIVLAGDWEKKHNSRNHK